MSAPASKKQRSHPQYELLYHPGIPGRGEFVRLPLEAAGISYTDVANSEKDGYSAVQAAFDQTATSIESNPPAFAPPILRVPGAGPDGKALLIAQTPNILSYLGPRIGLQADASSPDGGAEAEAAHFHVGGIVLTALDLNNEIHDTHHPVGTSLYYEDQKEESLRKSREVRELRIPKYFGYFERLLRGNEREGGGRYLVGGGLTTADTTVWQVVDGVKFAFPKEIEATRGEYPTLLGTFYESVRAERGIREYLASERRLPYSQGVFRHYPELDRQ